MKKLIICTILTLTITACGGNDRAATIDIPQETNTPKAAPTSASEPTTVPTAESEATATEPPPPTDTPEPTATLPPTETPTATPIPELNVKIDEEALLNSMLELIDFPTGWTISEAPSFEPRTPGGTYTFTCAELPSRSIARTNIEFQMSGFGPFLGNGISVYENRRDAIDALADLANAANECVEWADDEGTTYTLSPLSFPNLGDETFAIRVTGNIEADMIYMREGNAIIRILNMAFPVGVDSLLTEEMATIAIQRFEDNH